MVWLESNKKLMGYTCYFDANNDVYHAGCEDTLNSTFYLGRVWSGVLICASANQVCPQRP